jgi:transposase-like protein
MKDHVMRRRFVSVEALFNGRRFDRQIIILCVSWYTSFKLSFRDLVIIMAERGISLAHPTILRWVQHYLPEFEKRWKRYARPVGGSWRMDETYIKVRGQWVYLYRAVDKSGQTVDFFLSRKRDVNAAKSFLRRAMNNTRKPTKITLDAYAASHRAVREMKEDGELPRRVKVRSSQYLNNLIDKRGQTVDFYLSRKRDVNAAKIFLRKAIRHRRVPTKLTLDAYAASHRAVADLKQSRELPQRAKVRSSKYLNNLVEQDHRRVKQRLGPMLGLKSFRNTAVVIGGVELAAQIQKGQFQMGKLGGRTARVPELWQAALAA